MALPKLSIGVPAASLPPMIYRRQLTPAVPGQNSTAESTYYAGFLYDFFTELGRRAQFEIEFVPMGGNPYASDWNTVGKAMLRTGRVNLTWTNIPDEGHEPSFAQIPPIFTNTARILTRKTVRETGFMQIFAPFSNELWIAISLSIVFGAVIMVVINVLQYQGTNVPSDSARDGPSSEQVDSRGTKAEIKDLGDGGTSKKQSATGSPLNNTTVENSDIDKPFDSPVVSQTGDRSPSAESCPVRVRVVDQTEEVSLRPPNRSASQLFEQSEVLKPSAVVSIESLKDTATATGTNDGRENKTAAFLLDETNLAAKDDPTPPQDDEESPYRFFVFLYHTLAAMLGGDEYDLYHLPLYGRIHRIGLLFFVLILTNTYVANLAAFLTRPKYVIHGPQTIADIQSANVCCRWLGSAANFQYNYGFTGKFLTPPLSYFFQPARAGVSEEENAERLRTNVDTWAREQLFAGNCDAIVEMNDMAQSESLRFCDTLHLNPDVQLGAWYTTAYYLDESNQNEWDRLMATAATAQGTNYTCNSNETAALGFEKKRECFPTHPWLEFPGMLSVFVNRETKKILNNQMYFDMLQRNMRLGESCGNNADAETDDTIKLAHLAVAFIVYGSCSFLAVLFTWFERYQRSKRGEGTPELQTEVQNEKLDKKLNQVLERMERMEKKIK
ncbi:unnamed protein product [Amoebophrya sp. A120]|nr:unnamed protein product [Amoebophrya sp. A120]|eukprot:GSA120T00018728001.1